MSKSPRSEAEEKKERKSGPDRNIPENPERTKSIIYVHSRVGTYSMGTILDWDRFLFLFKSPKDLSHDKRVSFLHVHNTFRG